MSSGVWDSIHVVEVKDTATGKANYRLTTTIMLQLEAKSGQIGEMNLSGNVTRQVQKEMEVNDANTHLMNIGRLIESVENSLRLNLNDIYFSKTQEVPSLLL